MYKYISILTLLAVIAPVIGHGSEYSLPGYMFIGEIPVGCASVTNPEGHVKKPEGFKIAPDEAMKIAIENTRMKCVSKLQQVIYADSRNYYFFNSIVLAQSKDFISYSVVIDGVSGDFTDNLYK